MEKLLVIANQFTHVRNANHEQWETVPYQTKNEVMNGEIKISDGRRMTNLLYLIFNNGPDIELSEDILNFDEGVGANINGLNPGDICYVIYEKMEYLFDTNTLPENFRTHNTGRWFIFLQNNDDSTLVLYYSGYDATFVVSSYQEMIKDMESKLLQEILIYIKDHPEDKELFQHFNSSLLLRRVKSIYDYNKQQLFTRLITSAVYDYNDMTNSNISKKQFLKLAKKTTHEKNNYKASTKFLIMTYRNRYPLELTRNN